MVERYEYKQLTARGDFGMRWHDGDESIGDVTATAEVANRYAAEGWRVAALTLAGRYGQLLLERPARASELLPAAAPEGRGDEPTP
jgi:hypothetical protein